MLIQGYAFPVLSRQSAFSKAPVRLPPLLASNAIFYSIHRHTARANVAQLTTEHEEHKHHAELSLEGLYLDGVVATWTFGITCYANLRQDCCASVCVCAY